MGMAENMGREMRAPSRCQARDGRVDAAYRRDSAPHVDGTDFRFDILTLDAG